jgi:hypothetical protein
MPLAALCVGIHPRGVEGKQRLHRLVRFSHLVVILLLITTVGTALVPLGAFNSNADSSGKASLRDMLWPRLLALTDSVEEVESLVANRSRNILALQSHATRIEK